MRIPERFKEIEEYIDVYEESSSFISVRIGYLSKPLILKSVIRRLQKLVPHKSMFIRYGNITVNTLGTKLFHITMAEHKIKNATTLDGLIAYIYKGYRDAQTQ